jgi:hypothetical protein
MKKVFLFRLILVTDITLKSARYNKRSTCSFKGTACPSVGEEGTGFRNRFWPGLQLFSHLGGMAG